MKLHELVASVAYVLSRFSLEIQAAGGYRYCAGSLIPTLEFTSTHSYLLGRALKGLASHRLSSTQAHQSVLDTLLPPVGAWAHAPQLVGRFPVIRCSRRRPRASRPAAWGGTPAPTSPAFDRAAGRACDRLDSALFRRCFAASLVPVRARARETTTERRGQDEHQTTGERDSRPDRGWSAGIIQTTGSAARRRKR